MHLGYTHTHTHASTLNAQVDAHHQYLSTQFVVWHDRFELKAIISFNSCPSPVDDTKRWKWLYLPLHTVKGVVFALSYFPYFIKLLYSLKNTLYAAGNRTYTFHIHQKCDRVVHLFSSISHSQHHLSRLLYSLWLPWFLELNLSSPNSLHWWSCYWFFFFSVFSWHFLLASAIPMLQYIVMILFTYAYMMITGVNGMESMNFDFTWKCIIINLLINMFVNICLTHIHLSLTSKMHGEIKSRT